MSEGKFATSVSCIDGRIQIPLTNWIKENYSVDYVDTITEPGDDKNIALMLRADANTPHQSVVRAMDAASQLGLTRLSIATVEGK